jgi:hypothetical protein
MPTALAVDRTRICTFTFNNGRQCRIPLAPDHPHLCTFHARKDAQVHAAELAANDIAYSLSTRFISYNDLSSTLAHTISAVVRRRMTTRNASTVAYLTQNLLQSIAGAQHEYIETYGAQAWREQLADNLFTIRAPKLSASPQPPGSHLPAATTEATRDDQSDNQSDDHLDGKPDDQAGMQVDSFDSQADPQISAEADNRSDDQPNDPPDNPADHHSAANPTEEFIAGESAHGADDQTNDDGRSTDQPESRHQFAPSIASMEVTT